MMRLRITTGYAGVITAVIVGLFASSSLAGELSKDPRRLLPSTAVVQAAGPPAPVRVAQAAGTPSSHPTPPPAGSSDAAQGGIAVEDLLLQKGTITMDDWIRIKGEEEYKQADREKRADLLEEWKTKVEKLPVLTDKVNFGLNALQWLYTHQDAHVAEGKSQDNISIRRSELIFWGKISENLPRWHVLYEFQSINFGNNTPDCSGTTNCATKASGTATAATFFRESYIDYRPVLAWAPNLNMIRLGIFRMPFGIYTETSGGLRDFVSAPYLTSVGSGAANTSFGGVQPKNGTVGTIDFIQERDFFIDARGRIANRLEYVVGMMNNNNFHANSTGANAPKAFYSRARLFATDVSWVSFTVIAGESNNTNTNINGRGKGNFDRYAVDFRYTSKLIPGLMLQGEYWQGHDGANQTTVGLPAQGACSTQTQCGGDGAPGVQRRTWYVYGKYLITDGLFENFEPALWYEQFDPNTNVGNDLYTRTILGLTYYFENLPPKIQSKIQINYEFRHHSGNGPGFVPDPTRGVGDPFAQNALLVQWQIRYM